MIELAPQHKIGLVLPSPVMIGAGFGGYGEAYADLIDMTAFGALVTHPVTLRPQRGRPQPRLAEFESGFILNTGHQNPGVKQVIRQFGQVWSRLKRPVIVHLPAAEPDDLRRTARALSHATVVAGFELGVPFDARPADVIEWVRAVQAGSELPVLAKLPLPTPLDLVEAAATAYVDALVIGSPPEGRLELAQAGQFINGPLSGSYLAPLMVANLQFVATQVDLPLVASGGLHHAAAVETCLSLGAQAVQLDSLLFIDPQQAEAIARQASGHPA